MHRTAELLTEAGVPAGVFQIVHGAVPAVNALVDCPAVSALSFVGSSRVAQLVARRGRALDKRVLALGGAKNHLLALPDCDVEMTAADVVASFAGCAGQRCMAASVLLLVGPQPALLDAICAKAAALQAGQAAGQVGAVIDQASKERILGFINEAEAAGCELLVDGRGWAARPGCWVGPTVIRQRSPDDAALRAEIFGPVLSVLQVESEEEALRIEAADPHGNAAAVYTQSGAKADYFAERMTASMIGVNIGIPVPREPFSFGGMYPSRSKYGDCDITGAGCMRLFTRTRKITQKWGRFSSAVQDSAQFK